MFSTHWVTVETISCIHASQDFLKKRCNVVMTSCCMILEYTIKQMPVWIHSLLVTAPCQARSKQCLIGPAITKLPAGDLGAW